MTFDFESVMNLLKCLECGSPLGIEHNQLVCENVNCRHSYPIRDEIPQLLPEEDENKNSPTDH